MARFEHRSVAILVDRWYTTRREIDARWSAIHPRVIQERLSKLQEIVERNSERSRLLLGKLLGPLSLEPTCGGDDVRFTSCQKAVLASEEKTAG